MGLEMEVIKDYWPIISAVIFAVVWLVRLEGKANQNGRDITNLEERIARQRTEDLERLEKTMTSIATDVKTLLQRGSQ